MNSYIPLVDYPEPEKVFRLFLDQLPESYGEADKLFSLENLMDSTVVVVHAGILLGLMTIEVSKKSVVLHGISMNVGSLSSLDFARSVSRAGFDALEHIFMRLGKRQCICKVPPDALGAKGFLRRWGFKGLPDGMGGIKRDKGRLVYKLDRDRFELMYVKRIKRVS